MSGKNMVGIAQTGSGKTLAVSTFIKTFKDNGVGSRQNIFK
jgi:superfamily II DNA/RNA helicase